MLLRLASWCLGVLHWVMLLWLYVQNEARRCLSDRLRLHNFCAWSLWTDCQALGRDDGRLGSQAVLSF